MAEVRLEERMARLEGVIEGMQTRLGRLEQEVGELRRELREEIGELRGEIGELRRELRGEIGELRREIGELRQMVHTNFRWTMGVIIIMWVTIILAILFR